MNLRMKAESEPVFRVPPRPLRRIVMAAGYPDPEPQSVSNPSSMGPLFQNLMHCRRRCAREIYARSAQSPFHISPLPCRKPLRQSEFERMPVSPEKAQAQVHHLSRSKNQPNSNPAMN